MEFRSRVKEGPSELNPDLLEDHSGECSRRLQQTARFSRGTAPTEPLSSSLDLFHSCHELEQLVHMEHQVVRGYFRLLRAQRVLRARTGGAELERERNDALEQVQGISRGLYTPAWESRPLREALRDLWENSGIPEQFNAVLDLQELCGDPRLHVRAAIYRAAQEGLSNVVRHSGARRVRLSLREQDGCVILEVEDDGEGFNPEPDASRPAATAGIGLRSMRELAGQLGGKFQVSSSPKGTSLTMSFPLIR